MTIYQYVVECENRDGVESAEYDVTKAGGKVIATDYDGDDDGGDAFIDFTCEPGEAEEVCRKLGYTTDELWFEEKED